MASTPKIPEAKTPARKPERTVDVEPEDIQLGQGEQADVASGKRQLKRPRAAAGSGLQV